MATPVSSDQTWRFGVFEVDAQKVELRRHGKPVKVREQSFLILVYLLEHVGEVVTREELCRVLWPSNTFVDFDHSLSMAVMNLRDALGDSTDTPLYIETIPKRGYSFIASVTAMGDRPAYREEILKGARNRLTLTETPNIRDGNEGVGPLPGAAESAAGPSSQTGAGLVGGTTAAKAPVGGKRARRQGWLLTAAVLAASFAAVFWCLSRPLPPPRIMTYTQLTHDGREKWPVGTDGSRVYFTSFAPASISQVAVSGGEIAEVPIAVPNVVFMKGIDPYYSSLLEDVSPDGSSLLIASSEKGMVFNRPQWNIRVPGGSLRRLPDGAWTSFSPDGKTVAYATNAGDIWLVQSDGTGAHKLASVGGPANRLAWSPDGGALRFDLDGRIWEITSRGLNLHQVLRGFSATDGLCCGHWTADGDFYLFQVGNTEPETGQIWALDERRGLLRKPPSEPVQLTSGPTRWSWLVPGKDGKTIYAEGMTPRGELSRFDARSKRFLPFLGGISAGCVSFSNDGRFVAYVRYPEGTLWKANQDGSNRVQLTDPPISAHDPRWSPDGSQIAFMDVSNSASVLSTIIYIVPAVGGSAQKLFPGDEGATDDPTWSPDGRSIAFGWAPNRAGVSGPSEIHILDLASRQVTIVPGSSATYSPRWSPDGRYIAALSRNANVLKVFDMETQRWSVLVEEPAGGMLEYPWWSKDGRSIYFLSRRIPGVYRIPVAGGKEELIADLKDWAITGWWGWMGLDPTDSPMVLHDVGSQDIYALTMEQK